MSAAQLNTIITAELPTDDNDLRNLVLKTQIHKLRSEDQNANCRRKTATNECKGRYPFKKQEDTVIWARGSFMRRREGPSVMHPLYRTEIDNSDVVPHNRRILKRYGGHNIQLMRHNKTFKYIFG